MAVPLAKGLFHKAILESGATEDSGMTLTPSETSRYVTELTLKNLGIAPEEIDKIIDVPYAELASASNKALAQVAEEKNIINALGRKSLMWCPVVDGEYITQTRQRQNLLNRQKYSHNYWFCTQ